MANKEQKTEAKGKEPIKVLSIKEKRKIKQEKREAKEKNYKNKTYINMPDSLG